MKISISTKKITSVILGFLLNTTAIANEEAKYDIVKPNCTYEIREYSDAMKNLITDLCPNTIEAFDKYSNTPC